MLLPGFGFGQAKRAKLDTVRMGFAGVGGQGTGHFGNFLKIDGVEIKAVCDIDPSRIEHTQKMCADAGKPKPDGYTGHEDYKRVCGRDDIDLIYNATPWDLHVPVCLEAMNNGKHAATEIPLSVTLEGCWELVETAEKTGLECVMMENCNYDRVELMVLNIVRKKMLGELIHARCGYLHDLRGVKFSERGEGLWRLDHSIRRNGDLYPTHGLGPVAQCLNINRGNLFDHMVSTASKARGLKLFAEEKYGKESPQAKLDYVLGDVVTSVIKTRAGESIVVTHDTNLPRPYSRDILLQGTLGIVQKYPEPKIFIEGKSPRHGWEDLIENYSAEFEHPLWNRLVLQAKEAGHGGMDYIEDFRLIECLRTGTPMDTDVYDGAAVSAVSELSERSIAGRSKTMDFPDFTRGKWRNREPLGIIA
jgi:hypothetical protein